MKQQIFVAHAIYKIIKLTQHATCLIPRLLTNLSIKTQHYRVVMMPISKSHYFGCNLILEQGRLSVDLANQIRCLIKPFCAYQSVQYFQR